MGFLLSSLIDIDGFRFTDIGGDIVAVSVHKAFYITEGLGESVGLYQVGGVGTLLFASRFIEGDKRELGFVPMLATFIVGEEDFLVRGWIDVFDFHAATCLT